MNVSVRISKKEYLRLMFYLNRVSLGIILFCGLCLYIGVFLYFQEVLYFSDKTILYIYVGLAFFCVFLYPLLFYNKTCKYFDSYPMLQESVIYTFTEDCITAKAESYQSELGWDKLYKIIELKLWILIYNNKYKFYMLPKSSFGNNLDEFRTLVQSKPIKSKFRK